jgi:predicted dehydrogenase
MKQVINPGDAEDIFFAVMKTTDNVTIVSEFNICSDKLPNWVVQGDRGTIFVKGTEIEIHKASFPESIDSKAYASPAKIDVIKEDSKGLDNNRFGDSMVIYRHIAKAIKGEEAYKVTPESALQLTVLLDAVRKSNEAGQVVRLLD